MSDVAATNDALLSTNAVAEWLNIPPTTLHRWRKEGRGPEWIQLGPRHHRYRRDAVEAWLKERANA